MSLHALNGIAQFYCYVERTGDSHESVENFLAADQQMDQRVHSSK